MSQTYETEVEISGEDGLETPIIVHYTPVKAYKGATDGRFGPKLEPDEPAHIEIDWVEGPDGKPITLTDEMEEALAEKIFKYEEDKADDYRASWYEGD